MAAFYEKGFTQDSIGNEKSSILFIEEMITTYTQSSYWCNVCKMLFWQQYFHLCVFVNQTSLNLSVLIFSESHRSFVIVLWDKGLSIHQSTVACYIQSCHLTIF